MNNDTFEYTERKQKLETYEWDDMWLEYANDSDTYRVLYIGDSISRGMRYVLNELADGKIRFDNLATSKAVDNPFFDDAVRMIAKQETKQDMVLFNNGLHGFHLNVSEYKEFYEERVKFLVNEFTDIKIILVLTTYTDREERYQTAVNERNEAVKNLAAKYGLPFVDLYSVSYNNRDMLAEDRIHMSGDGYKELAKAVLEQIDGIKTK